MSQVVIAVVWRDLMTSVNGKSESRDPTWLCSEPKDFERAVWLSDAFFKLNLYLGI